MKYKALFLFVLSLLIGFIFVTQYQSYRYAQQELSRDSSLNYVSQVNLLIQDNDQLKKEAERLQTELDNSRSAVDANALLTKEIENYALLVGSKEITGPGVKIQIDLPLEHYWLVDLVNELYLSGAQAISLNNLRLTGDEGFLEQEEQAAGNYQIYLNNEKLLERPYTLSAIGDAELLYSYLTKYNSVLKRLETSFLGAAEAVQISQEENLKIPAAITR